MKNKFLIIIGLVCFFLSFSTYSSSQEEFYFKVTEIDITENGNLIVGSKGGKAITNNGFEIIAENFIYNKLTNILNAQDNVKFLDIENGNSLKSIIEKLKEAKKETNKNLPVCLLIKTEMGNGVDFMMNTHEWHGVAPNDEQLQIALSQNPETLGDY